MASEVGSAKRSTISKESTESRFRGLVRASSVSRREEEYIVYFMTDEQLEEYQVDGLYGVRQFLRY